MLPAASTAEAGVNVELPPFAFEPVTGDHVEALFAEDTDAVSSLMVRNLPRKYTISEVLHELNLHVPLESINFLSVPWDMQTRCNVGFAFISFVDKETADRVFAALNGSNWSFAQSAKTIKAQNAHVQGLGKNILHCGGALPEGLEKRYYPLVLLHGKQLDFSTALKLVQQRYGQVDENTPVGSTQQENSPKRKGVIFKEKKVKKTNSFPQSAPPPQCQFPSSPSHRPEPDLMRHMPPTHPTLASSTASPYGGSGAGSSLCNSCHSSPLCAAGSPPGAVPPFHRTAFRCSPEGLVGPTLSDNIVSTPPTSPFLDSWHPVMQEPSYIGCHDHLMKESELDMPPAYLDSRRFSAPPGLGLSALEHVPDEEEFEYARTRTAPYPQTAHQNYLQEQQQQQPKFLYSDRPACDFFPHGTRRASAPAITAVTGSRLPSSIEQAFLEMPKSTPYRQAWCDISHLVGKMQGYPVPGATPIAL